MKKILPNIVQLIKNKRDGQKLSADEITQLVLAYTDGSMPDYQMAAFLMTVYFQGMDFHETSSLMQAMKKSGAILDLSVIQKPIIDKHSTGGVGDKVSLILAPLIASCGICVPMISGRGLGHTGGTLDKLESIPGFKTRIPRQRLMKQLKKHGVAMVGQTAEIAPADRKMYALRDVTATVDSIPLIAASIMSKKLAESLHGLVLDVKFGSGAFIKEYRHAKNLAKTMIEIGRRAGIKVSAILTDMNNVLGEYVGNSLEVIEAIECLRGKGPEDLMNVTYALGKEMLRIGAIKGGIALLKKKIRTGEALNKFRQLICLQGGDVLITDDYRRLPVASKTYGVRAQSTGYLHHIDTYQVGMLLVTLGGGRLKKEDPIDPSCGFRISKKIGDRVKKGEDIATLYCDDSTKALAVKNSLPAVFVIRKKPCRAQKLVREILR